MLFWSFLCCFSFLKFPKDIFKEESSTKAEFAVYVMIIKRNKLEMMWKCKDKETTTNQNRPRTNSHERKKGRLEVF